jgi:hypothetical protein
MERDGQLSSEQPCWTGLQPIRCIESGMARGMATEIIEKPRSARERKPNASVELS